jgi:hypothetical protein
MNYGEALVEMESRRKALREAFGSLSVSSSSEIARRK